MQEVKYKIGDTVLLKQSANKPGKFNMRWEEPHHIIEQKGNINIKLLNMSNGKTYVTHADRIKLFPALKDDPSQDQDQPLIHP